MSHSLAKFTLEDMVILGACLRSFDLQPRSLEEVAQNVVRLLHQELLDTESGAHTCARIHFYITSEYGVLPDDLQQAARDTACEVPLEDRTHCLVLLASAGEKHDTGLTARGRVMPLDSSQVILSVPLVVQLFRQLGISMTTVADPCSDQRPHGSRNPCQVIHVARAIESPYVPDQDFVRTEGIESVLALAGVLPGGRVFAAILYIRVPIPAPTVHMFHSLALNIKMPLLQFSEGPVFGSEVSPSSLALSSPRFSTAIHSQVRMVALQQLLDSYEQTVVDQGFKLQAIMQKLRESEVRFRRFLESSVIGIAIIVGGVVAEANATFLRLLDCERSDLPLAREAIIAPECFDLHDRSLQQALATGSAPPYEACYLKRQGGRVFVLEGKVLLDREQETVAALLLDLTAQKDLEAEFRQAQKLEAMGRLAAGVAHEINTPIQYVGLNLRFLQDAFTDLGSLVQAYQEVIRGGDLAPSAVEACSRAEEQIDLAYLQEEVPRAIQQGLDGAERVATIVRAMKEFSHPGSPDKTPVDLNHALQSTIDVSRNEWKYVAEMVTDFDADLPLVPCLQGEMNQVFLNLIVNAADAIGAVVAGSPEARGIITIRTRRAGDEAEISIHDTGTGIPEDIRQKVFEPFFTTKEVGKGTGQGLALARSVVVDKHGGSLALDSREGAGTTFTIRLPFSDGK